jgi:hypothetical protein
MRGGGDPAEPETGPVDLDRDDRLLDVASALLAGGVLLGLLALVWVLGFY